jgi:hypothetical protein
MGLSRPRMSTDRGAHAGARRDAGGCQPSGLGRHADRGHQPHVPLAADGQPHDYVFEVARAARGAGGSPACALTRAAAKVSTCRWRASARRRA